MARPELKLNHEQTDINYNPKKIMILIPMLAVAPMLAAAGYSLVYLLAGGGLGGAVLIFIVAKMLGK